MRRLKSTLSLLRSFSAKLPEPPEADWEETAADCDETASELAPPCGSQLVSNNKNDGNILAY